MAEVPDGAKKPQDRKTKTKNKYLKDVPDCYTFEHDGETYTFKPTADYIKPGFLRKYRNAAAEDMLYSALELVASERQLEVLDNDMSLIENREFLRDFEDYMSAFFEVSLGE